MSDDHRDALDRALASVPREVQPPRDLWPRIAENIADESAGPAEPDAAGVRGQPPPGRADDGAPGWPRTRYLQLAASLVFIFATAVTAFFVGRESLDRDPPQVAANDPPPASFGNEQLGPEYLQARASLEATLEERLAQLPPETRAGVERSLADLRRAAHEISVQLAQHPNDPLLQELLLSAYQVELAVLADVNQVTAATQETTI